MRRVGLLRGANNEALEAVMNAALTTETTNDWFEVLEPAGRLRVRPNPTLLACKQIEHRQKRVDAGPGIWFQPKLNVADPRPR